MSVTGIVLALLVMPVSAGDAKNNIIQPTSNWEVSKSSEGTCSANRAFDNGNFIISINSPILRDEYFVKFLSKKPVLIRQGDQIRITISPKADEIFGSADGFAPIGERQNLFGLLVDKDKLNIDGTDTISIYVKDKNVRNVNSTGMFAALKELKACSDRLVNGYGIDVDKFKQVAVQPRALISAIKIIGPDNYPSAALKNKEQGRVGIRFNVNKKGNVDACNIVVTSGNTLLDEGTCDVVKSKAIYEPAKNLSGDSVDADQIMFVNWTIPR